MTVAPVPELKDLFEIEVEELIRALRNVQKEHGDDAKVRFDAGFSAIQVYVKRQH